MTGPAPLPPVEERALATSKRANYIAIISLASSLISGVASVSSCQQASKANDTIAATRASNVYFDSQNNGQRTDYYIVNRNKEPVLDVYYTYKLSTGLVNENVFIGVVEACTKVLTQPPKGANSKPGYRPVELFLKDNNGDSWRREESGQVDRTNGNDLFEPNRNLIAHGSSIDGGC